MNGLNSKDAVLARRQGGATLLGIMALLVLGAVVLTIGLRAGPVYMNAWTISGIVSELPDDRDLRGAGPRDVGQALTRRFTINSVDGIDDEDISIERRDDGVEVVVEYEHRFLLIANLDGVAAFRFEALVPQ